MHRSHMWTAAAPKLRVGTRQSTRNPKNVSTGETYQRLLVCTWRHSIHIGGVFGHFSHLETKPYFHVNFSRKNYIVLTTNTPPTWQPCNWYHNFSENRSSLFIPYPFSKQNIYHIVTKEKKHFKSLPHISIFYLFISLFLSPPLDAEVLSSGLHYGNYDGVKTLWVIYKLKGLLGISIVSNSNTQLILLTEVYCAL